MTSATAAYRKDLASRDSAFGPRDGDWIMVASLVAHAAEYSHRSAPDDVEAQRVAWEQAIELSIASVGSSDLDRLAAREWGSGWSDADALTLISMPMADAGAYTLSALLVDSLLRVRRDAQDLAYGRALAQRARMMYLGGDHDVAEDLYGQIDRLANRLASVELRARAANGFVGVAHKRGNHPRMLDAARRGLELAEQTNIPRIRWNARYSIMLSCAMFKNYDEALVHGWELLHLTTGDEHGEGTALNALGQLLLEMGDVETARSAFAAVVTRRLPERMLLAALSSLAHVAALSRDGDRDTLQWAVAEVERFREYLGDRWSYTSALLDCTEALRDVGEVDRARVLRDEALALAIAHRFHALAHRAEHVEFNEPTPTPHRAPVHARGIEVVRSVSELAPERLPRHVRLATAGA